ncbi:hypothetical protein DPEC_G00216600 [Dallia pectoralis]|uniref:Uncharacterized protein n=1 Tax=Dallia pectoralis TaxID=75939 RepID=A0ACC2G2P9_DALPE|nr:hypothetical protein DPEC_G00216600 [Dallia pectoralis]
MPATGHELLHWGSATVGLLLFTIPPLHPPVLKPDLHLSGRAPSSAAQRTRPSGGSLAGISGLYPESTSENWLPLEGLSFGSGRHRPQAEGPSLSCEGCQAVL